MTNTLFIGIDVSKKNNVVRFTDSDGDTMALFSVKNNQDGANLLLGKIHDLFLISDFSSISIGIESTSIYADHLAVFLRQDDFLKKWNEKLLSLTPSR